MRSWGRVKYSFVQQSTQQEQSEESIRRGMGPKCKILLISFGTLFSLFLLIYLLIPLIFHLSPFIQRNIVFLPYMIYPNGVNFSDPSSQEVIGARNLYLNSESNVTIGVWHMLPMSLANHSNGQNESFWTESLRNSGKNIIIYLHGNSGSRAGYHRKGLYKKLQELEFHVIAFDYRGYADSSQISPSESGTVEDGNLVYKWVREIIGKYSTTQIFIWGHSLGTGVSTRTVSNLINEGDEPNALILEAPFPSFGEAMKNHRFNIYRYFPFFDEIFISPLRKNDFAFENELNIVNVTIHILIMHAVDDPIVSVSLGEKLFETAQKLRPNNSQPIYFTKFESGQHNRIYQAQDFLNVVKSFSNCVTMVTNNSQYCNYFSLNHIEIKS